MQIDFHHGATYVIARYAGFEHADASTIANAAQYVDDSTTSGFIRFDNGMRYMRSATAHPMTDLDNLSNEEDAISWLPFHFLPGNEPRNADGNYVRKLVCRPDSFIAREMIAAAQRAKGEPFGLHRLGIAAHVFIDTFAHRGFAGLNHPINAASDVMDSDGNALFVLPVPHIGHGQVGTYPDCPYLHWSYLDWDGNRVDRDNPTDFLHASIRLCEEFQRFLDLPVTGLSDIQQAKIAQAIAGITDSDGDKRHAKWIEKIAKDDFGFGAAGLEYTAKATWKHDALGAGFVQWLKDAKDEADKCIAKKGDGWLHRTFSALSGKVERTIGEKAGAAADFLGSDIPIESDTPVPFLDSDYKKFHDAAKAQRNDVLASILPKFGIIAA